MAVGVEAVFFDLGDTLGVAELDPLLRRLTGFHLFPFVTSLLEELARRGLRAGIVSNTGEETGDAIEVVLEPTGVLTLLQPQLRIYSADVGLRKDTPEIFRLAAGRAGLADAPDRCVYVGEDVAERMVAQGAGMRVCPHPLLLWEVVDLQPLRFVRVTLPLGPREQWYRELRAHPFVPLQVSGLDGREVIGITSERTRGAFAALGLALEPLGDPELPSAADLFLVRDDASNNFGISGPTRGAFDRGDGPLVLASRSSEHLIALRANRQLSDLQLEGARHGHTVKLVADPLLLEPLFGQAAPRTNLGGFAAASVTLSPVEREHLGRIGRDFIIDRIERYSGHLPISHGGTTMIRSRHVAHADNAAVVRQLAEDLESAGDGRLKVRLLPFTHRGRTLYNVEAELRGASDELVLVTAHLDSTAAFSAGYDEATDAAPGADDDASGVAAVVDCAAQLVALAEARALGRSLRFVLFNAEEEGLVGSRVYARLQRSLGAKIVAVFHMDMIAFNKAPPASWEVHVGYPESLDVERRSLELARLVQALTKQVAPRLEAPVLFDSGAKPEGDPAAGRSDHASFHAYGYAACVSSERFFGGDDADANPNYHRQEDRVDAAGFDADFAADISRVLATASWVLARATPTDLKTYTAAHSLTGSAMARGNPREFDSRKAVGAQRSITALGPLDRARRDQEFGASTTGLAAVIREAPTVFALTDARRETPADRVGRSGWSLIDKALAYMSRQVVGFGSEGAPSFQADPSVQRTAGGGAAVHLQQSYHGIPVFQMAHTVRFAPSGDLLDAPGKAAVIEDAVDTLPKLAAEAAVRRAAEYLVGTGAGLHETDEFGQAHPLPTIDISGFAPQVAAAFSLPERPTVFEKGPFENAIPAHLVMFVQPQRTRLAWHTVLTFPDYADQYVVIVAADAPGGEILYSRRTLSRAVAQGRVYEFSPGVAERRLVEFPRPLSDYPVMPSTPLAGFPSDWVAVNVAQGNSTQATLGTSTQTLVGVDQKGTIVFDPADAYGDDQKLLNIFYFCNYMHDFLFVLGFDEAAGNFQKTNFTHTGLSGDFVRARSHSGPVFGTANMSTGPDGLPPLMNMGLVVSTNRHTAFDADVVFHEFSHGLTERLIGGPLDEHSLAALQSGGMGEGWGDFFALSVQNFFRASEKTVTGDWVLNRPGGLRRAPYDDNYPFTYADLRASPEVHDIGEVWCATLLMLVRRMQAVLGDKRSAYRLAWQIVVDGLKLTPANPTFLQARDAILLALDHLAATGRIAPATYSAARKVSWEAFARFGMGVNAQSEDADNVDDIVADFALPPGI
jgi:hypothetical protein